MTNKNSTNFIGVCTKHASSIPGTSNSGLLKRKTDWLIWRVVFAVSYEVKGKKLSVQYCKYVIVLSSIAFAISNVHILFNASTLQRRWRRGATIFYFVCIRIAEVFCTAADFCHIQFLLSLNAHFWHTLLSPADFYCLICLQLKMDAKLLFFTVIMSVISCAFGYPAERSEEVGLTDSVVSSVKGSGEYLLSDSTILLIEPFFFLFQVKKSLTSLTRCSTDCWTRQCKSTSPKTIKANSRTWSFATEAT